jgi:hypothetical protein
MTTTPTLANAENSFLGALRSFLASPTPTGAADLGNAASFLSLTTATSGNVTGAAPDGWWSVAAHPGDWDKVRASFDRTLSAAEIIEAAGCIGYALRIYMAGEELSLPTVEVAEPGKTVLSFFYDSTKARRSEPDAVEAFAEAGRYIVEGTPVRKTNRAGVGTAGTRLSAGIGAVSVEFYVK